jgi:hypothetical protein
MRVDDDVQLRSVWRTEGTETGVTDATVVIVMMTPFPQMEGQVAVTILATWVCVTYAR